jgi:hypothetical protein
LKLHLDLLEGLRDQVAFGQEKFLHGYAGSNRSVNNALVSMYIKSGSIELGRRVFYWVDKRRRDVVSWNSFIPGYGMHGLYNEAGSTMKWLSQGRSRVLSQQRPLHQFDFHNAFIHGDFPINGFDGPTSGLQRCLFS